MTTTNKPPLELHDYQKAAVARIRAMPVQFFWPPAASHLRLRAVVVAIITTKTPE